MYRFFFDCSVMRYVSASCIYTFGAVDIARFSQILQTSIPLPTNAKEKITGLYEQRLPPPPFASV